MNDLALTEKPLNPQQVRFVSEYLSDSSSGKAAASRAGYSIHTASDQASRLLKDPRVIRMLEEARSQAMKTLGITAERVMQELWKVAGANPGDVVTLNEEGEADIDPRFAGEVAVTTIGGKDKKVRQVTSKTIKPSDKIAALTTIAKIGNFFPNEAEIKINMSFADMVAQSIKPDDSQVIEGTAA